MKEQNLKNELILTFEDVDNAWITWKREIDQLLAIVEKEKKKN